MDEGEDDLHPDVEPSKGTLDTIDTVETGDTVVEVPLDQTLVPTIDGDVLDELIEILSNSSDDFLDSHVDEEKLPGITYRDILEKMKQLKQEIIDEEKKTFLESVMVDWAMHNDPDKVDKKMLSKIHETATLLNELLHPRLEKGENL